MDAGAATDLVRQAVLEVLVLGAPMLLAVLATALVVSILQAVTQVQEHTLSLVPKIAAMLAAVLVFGPWMMHRLVEFSRSMFATLP